MPYGPFSNLRSEDPLIPNWLRSHRVRPAAESTSRKYRGNQFLACYAFGLQASKRLALLTTYSCVSDGQMGSTNLARVWAISLWSRASSSMRRDQGSVHQAWLTFDQLPSQF